MITHPIIVIISIKVKGWSPSSYKIIRYLRMTEWTTAVNPRLRTTCKEGKGRITSGCRLACGALCTPQVLQQLHRLSSHYDLLQDRLEERHHGVLPTGGAMVTARTRTGIVTHFFFIFWYTLQCVSCIPKVSRIYWNIFVAMEIQKNFKLYLPWKHRTRGSSLG
jgi:hypothetical protein